MSANDKWTANSNLSAFFILTFAFTWFFWLFGIMTSLNIISFPVPNLVWVVIGAHGPLVASFWLTYKASGLPAVKKLLLSGFQLRMKLVWWAVIFAVPFLLAGMAFWVNVSTGDFKPDTTLQAQPLLIIPNFLFMFFLGGSFQEEFGWRKADPVRFFIVAVFGYGFSIDYQGAAVLVYKGQVVQMKKNY